MTECAHRALADSGSVVDGLGQVSVDISDIQGSSEPRHENSTACPSEKHPKVFLRASIKIDGTATVSGFRRVLDVAERSPRHPDPSGVEVEVVNAQSQKFTGTQARGVGQMEWNKTLY